MSQNLNQFQQVFSHKANKKELDKGAVVFSKMPKREIEFTQKSAYLKDSTDPDRVSDFYKIMKSTDHSPKISKQKIFEDKTIPRYLLVFFR